MTLTVVATSPQLVTVPATVTAVKGTKVTLRLKESVAIGAKVILELPPEQNGPLATASVLQCSGTSLEISVQRTFQREPREYPRLVGSVALRYRAAGDDDEKWLRGDSIPGQEHEPDPFMNFSVTGLAFDSKSPLIPGDRVWMSLAVPRRDVRRAVGRVIRVTPIPEDERDPDNSATHRIAVVFETIEPQGFQDLFEYTESLLSAL